MHVSFGIHSLLMWFVTEICKGAESRPNWQTPTCMQECLKPVITEMGENFSWLLLKDRGVSRRERWLVMTRWNVSEVLWENNAKGVVKPKSFLSCQQHYIFKLENIVIHCAVLPCIAHNQYLIPFVGCQIYPFVHTVVTTTVLYHSIWRRGFTYLWFVHEQEKCSTNLCILPYELVYESTQIKTD